ncbi:hypothetical protein V6L77_21665 [Pannonibacter sp. Pt2-lr]
MSGKQAAVPTFKGYWRASSIFLSGMIGFAGRAVLLPPHSLARCR